MMIRVSMAVLMTALCAFTFSFAGENTSSDQGLTLAIQKTVKGFLDGEDTRSMVAMVVNGEFSETVPDGQALAGQFGNCTFEFLKALVSDDMKTVVLTLKTNSSGTVHWHTFALVKEGARWRVKTWHLS